MRLETLPVPSDVELEDCFWKDEPQKDKSFNFFLRVFHVHRPDLKPERSPELGLTFVFTPFHNSTHFVDVSSQIQHIKIAQNIFV